MWEQVKIWYVTKRLLQLSCTCLEKRGITQQVATGKQSNMGGKNLLADIPNKVEPMSWRRIKKGSLTCASTVHFSPHLWHILSHKHKNTLSLNAPTDWLSCCEKKDIVIYNSKSGKRTLCADVWSDDKAHKYSQIYFCFPTLSLLSDLTKTILCCSEYFSPIM